MAAQAALRHRVDRRLLRVDFNCCCYWQRCLICLMRFVHALQKQRRQVQRWSGTDAVVGKRREEAEVSSRTCWLVRLGPMGHSAVAMAMAAVTVSAAIAAEAAALDLSTL